MLKECQLEECAFELLELLTENKKQLISAIGPPKTAKFSGDRHILGRNCMMLLGATLQRSYMLIEGGINALNNKNFYVMALCIRCSLETAASMGFLLRKLLLFYEGKSTDKKIFKSIANLMLGSRTESFQPAGEAVNILTLLENADKIFHMKFIPEEKENLKTLSEAYDFISEFCHPNVGANSLCTNLDKENNKFEFTIGKTICKREMTFINELVLSSSFLLTFNDEIYKLIVKNEDMPEIIRKT